MKGSEFIPKSDVRQLIKVTRTKTNKINHPYARYNQLGRISCIVCGVQIKSEFAWQAHILSRTHKQNESREHQNSTKRASEQAGHTEPPTKQSRVQGLKTSDSIISKDTEQSNPKAPGSEVILNEKNPAEKTGTMTSESKLPEGFFDDRYKDAKIRNVPYKDKITEEVEQFQREMIALEKESEQIVEKEMEAIVSDRNLEEIDTQLEKWKHIENLQIESEKWGAKQRSKPEGQKTTDAEIKQEASDSESDIDDIDELYDFRRKNTAT
ncbi:unnamed protein product [Calicophoron daubneyi]|uniref:Zinc finger protein 830 n=1 Tax=Calicophoron daubneyi TaxID=300641 RepID=A0AAV2TJG2_CALDB